MNNASSRSADIIIVGGGIIGLLTARMLALEGLRVVLLEAGRVGTQSSWAGGGILSPLCPWRAPAPITALCRVSQAMYPELTASLRDETGIDPEWMRCGLVFVDCCETTEALTWCAQETVEAHLVQPQKLQDLEPALSHASAASLWLPSIAQVRNPRLLQALRASLLRLGVALVEEQPVLGFETARGHVAAVRTSGGAYTARHFIVAAGAWTATLMPASTPSLPIVPVKGQMLAYAAAPGLISRIIVSGDRYLIPRRDGVIVAGSTVESAGFDKTITDEARADLEGFAQGLLTPLRSAKILRHWAGLRPGTPNGIPYIARSPEFDNLVLCAGHFRNGFVMAPASCRLLADLVLGHTPLLPPEPYALDAAH